MKYFLLLIIPAFSFSQVIARNEIDEFTKDKVIQVNCMKGKYWKESDKVSKGMLNYLFISTLYVLPDKSSTPRYYLQLGMHNLGVGTCLSDFDGKCILLFSDKSTMELKQSSPTSCEGKPLTGKYLININEAEKIKNTDLEKLRVYTTNGYVDYEIKDDKKSIIKDHIKIILEESSK